MSAPSPSLGALQSKIAALKAKLETERASRTRAEAEHHAKSDCAPSALTGHILIVEDNAINQMLVGAYIDTFGLTHESVDNGMDAIQMVAAGAFDVVLMDIMMPQMDGIETARRIRALDSPASQTPIIALTARALAGDREVYLAAGMDGYVSKPINADELLRVLAKVPTVTRAPMRARG